MVRLVSHDLRSPLWRVRGFAEFLRDDHAEALGEAGRSTLEHLLDATDDLGRVIDGLVDLALVSEAPLHARLVDMTGLARDVAALLSASEPARVVDWRVREGLVALGDPALLRILLEKLMSNAFKFADPQRGAVVEVSASPEESEDMTVFFVRDNGVGFDPARAPRLFSPFQRLHPSATYPGVGIGLAIVDRIMRRHRGRVWAEGAPGTGATFHFALPAAR